MMNIGKPSISVQYLQTVSVLLLCWLLAGCGFHLRGAYQLPPQMAVTHVTAKNMHSDLVRSLKRSLQASDITLADTQQGPVAVLQIVSERTDKRVLSVDELGRAREYEISYRVRFVLRAENIASDEHELDLIRDFLFDPEDVLGKGNEEAMLMRAMQNDMVRMIMLRLQAIKPVAELPLNPSPAP